MVPVPLEPGTGPADPVPTHRRRPAGRSDRQPVRRRPGDRLGAVARLRSRSGSTATATEHRLAAVAVDGSQRVVTLADDGDFVAAPRPSPDGRWLAWVGWDHPSMPWDSSGLWLAAHRGVRDGRRRR